MALNTKTSEVMYSLFSMLTLFFLMIALGYFVALLQFGNAYTAMNENNAFCEVSIEGDFMINSFDQNFMNGNLTKISAVVPCSSAGHYVSGFT